jgi:hypothetical protein
MRIEPQRADRRSVQAELLLDARLNKSSHAVCNSSGNPTGRSSPPPGPALFWQSARPRSHLALRRAAPPKTARLESAEATLLFAA